MPEMSTSETHGHVDDKRRPLVRLFFCGVDEEYLAHIDTGCSLTIVSDDAFVAECNLKWTGWVETAAVASGELWEFKEFEARVRWLGQERVIYGYVPVPPDTDNQNGPRTRIRRSGPVKDGDPRILLGVGMLEGTTTSINFSTNKITITPA